jgi:hypothetical protein
MAGDDTELDDTTKGDDLEIVRYGQGPRVFGLAASTLKSKIDNHEIPAPFPLSETGTALGWTKGMIRKHHERMAALAADRRAAAALVPAEKRIKPPALVKHQRKRKLRPPAAKRK